MDELFDREFNKKIDKYLATSNLTAEDYESCTTLQKHVIQVIKRAFKRCQIKDYERTNTNTK